MAFDKEAVEKFDEETERLIGGMESLAVLYSEGYSEEDFEGYIKIGEEIYADIKTRTLVRKNYNGLYKMRGEYVGVLPQWQLRRKLRIEKNDVGDAERVYQIETKEGKKYAYGVMKVMGREFFIPVEVRDGVVDPLLYVRTKGGVRKVRVIDGNAEVGEIESQEEIDLWGIMMFYDIFISETIAIVQMGADDERE
jgi:hypothetical protein